MQNRKFIKSSLVIVVGLFSLDIFMKWNTNQWPYRAISNLIHILWITTENFGKGFRIATHRQRDDQKTTFETNNRSRHTIQEETKKEEKQLKLYDYKLVSIYYWKQFLSFPSYIPQKMQFFNCVGRLRVRLTFGSVTRYCKNILCDKSHKKQS